MERKIFLPPKNNELSLNDVLDRNQNKQDGPVNLWFLRRTFILFCYLTFLGFQSNQISKRLKSCIYQFYFVTVLIQR